MAYIRKKSEYYYLVEGVREGGKVKQKTLAYLGKWPTLKSAIWGLFCELSEGEYRSYHAHVKTRRRFNKLIQLAHDMGNEEAIDDLLRRAEKADQITELKRTLDQARKKLVFREEHEAKTLAEKERKDRKERYMEGWSSSMNSDSTKAQHFFGLRWPQEADKGPGPDITALRRFLKTDLTDILWALEQYSEEDRDKILGSIRHMALQVGWRFAPDDPAFQTYAQYRRYRTTRAGSSPGIWEVPRKTLKWKEIDVPEIIGLHNVKSVLERTWGKSNKPIGNILAHLKWERLSPEAISFVAETCREVVDIVQEKQKPYSYPIAKT